jgi:hypothetical protein
MGEKFTIVGAAVALPGGEVPAGAPDLLLHKFVKADSCGAP